MHKENDRIEMQRRANNNPYITKRVLEALESGDEALAIREIRQLESRRGEDGGGGSAETHLETVKWLKRWTQNSPKQAERLGVTGAPYPAWLK